ncbi:DMT family transporter [Paeniroseomonas aquatica]|uniref:DMT family transporter n=1 Tax=Paeniroseomonas aquatica TaxID=373043 RepID=A0ABT8A7X2_9PROT|nr:DMT family transporter [Paeniroseomonas aquatica]MDN3565857.1 DMT family transporter [Paeniroseomonas aquatica]
MKGPALLLAGIVLFSVNDANSKLLSGHYGIGQVIFLRYVMLLPAFLAARALLAGFGRPGFGGPLATRHPWLQAFRACSMMVSAAGFFLGFRHLPLAEGYLVFFTAPLLTLVLAAAFLREPVPRIAWVWCLVGFGGVLLSVAPKLGGGGGPAVGYLAVLAGTVAFAVNQTLNRRLRAEPGLVGVILWPSLVGLVLFGPMAAADWAPAPPGDILRMLANGALAGGAVICTAAAYRASDAARLGPWGFAALPVSVAFDLAIWDRWPDAATLLGGAVVVGACLMSERARRRALAQAIPAGKAWVPSAPSGKATTLRTAESGKAP